MKNPHGIADFATIRREGYFYADKTGFIPELESAEAGHRYLHLCRPPGFGKTTLLSMLEHYYDRSRAVDFEVRFKGLEIHEAPSVEQGRYLALRLDLSSLEAGADPTVLRRSLRSAVRRALQGVLDRYAEELRPLERFTFRLREFQEPASLLGEFLQAVAASGEQLYLLIDDCDDLALELLARGEASTYQELVQGTGAFGALYGVLREYAGRGVVARLLATGLSAMPFSDLGAQRGSAFVRDISRAPRLAGICGLDSRERDKAIDQFLDSHENVPRTELLESLSRHFDGHLFCEEAEQTVSSPRNILYYLSQWHTHGRPPREATASGSEVNIAWLERIAINLGSSRASVAAAGQRAALASSQGAGLAPGQRAALASSQGAGLAPGQGDGLASSQGDGFASSQAPDNALELPDGVSSQAPEMTPGSAQDRAGSLVEMPSWLEPLLLQESIPHELESRFPDREIRGLLLSHLYDNGLLSIDGHRQGQLWLRIPNLSCQRRLWEELAFRNSARSGTSLKSREVREVVATMAYDGNLEPFISLLQDRVLTTLSIQPYEFAIESILSQAFLSTLSLSPIYLPLSRSEFDHKAGELLLSLDPAFPDARFAWLIELLCLETGAGVSEIEEARAEANTRLAPYLNESKLLARLKGKKGLRAATLVVVGFSECYWWLEQEV